MNILNLGLGVQSTTLYVMSCRGDEPEFVPRFDYAIFADTQEEPREVYGVLDWLKTLGGPPILTATAGKLGDDLVAGVNSRGQRFASIPGYTLSPDGSVGMTRRQCTADYKISVIERVIRREILGLAPRQRIGKGVRINQYLGLSFDEGGRIYKVKARYQDVSWAVPRFPLWEMEMTRRGCLRYLESVVPDRRIAKSACVFCPFKSDASWRDLRDNDPDGWSRAVEVDRSLRENTSVCNTNMNSRMFVHRSCVPLDRAPIDTPESLGRQLCFDFDRECEGMCGV